MGTATEEKKEVYDQTCVYSIIAKAGLKGEKGYIDALMSTVEATSLLLRGYCKTHINFISDIDRGIWAQKWKALARKASIDYSIGPVAGEGAIFKKEIEKVDYKSIEEYSNEFASLIEEHHKSACSYNQKIAKPFISGRKTLIDKL